jgi:alkaline phosphatase D
MRHERSRRSFLADLGRGSLAAVTLAHCGPVDDVLRPDWIDGPEPGPEDLARVYPQGVASADPRPDGALLWTRIEPDGDGPVLVEYVVAEDPEFAAIAIAGAVEALAADDFTLRVRLVELTAGRRYWYRFFARGVMSPPGRTSTAPAADADAPVRFAVASCQDYLGRYYHAWRALVEQADDLDFVLFLGDYIYEYTRYPDLQEPTPERRVELPDGLVIDEAEDIVAARTLADYRAIYRTVRSDPDLQEIHRLVPFVAIWDDHEHANDAWGDHAVDFDGAEGDEQDTARREAATQAWFEHVPVDVVRDAAAGFPDDIVVWRTLRWGQRLELVLTDQRYYRDDHLIPEGPADPDVGKFLENSPLGSRTFVIKEPFDTREAAAAPTMLGAAQRDWLISALKASDARWKLWGSALMVAQMALDLRGIADVPPTFQNIYYFKTDQWDGFRSERAQILAALADVENLVVLSGDLHGFYAAEVRVDPDDLEAEPVAAEFTVAGISSISLVEQVTAVVAGNPLLAATGLGAVVPMFDEVLQATCPHFVHARSDGYGAAVVTVEADALAVEFVAVEGVREPTYGGVASRTGFRVSAGSSRITPA